MSNIFTFGLEGRFGRGRERLKREYCIYVQLLFQGIRVFENE